MILNKTLTIQGLKNCIIDNCSSCPYYRYGEHSCHKTLMRDAREAFDQYIDKEIETYQQIQREEQNCALGLLLCSTENPLNCKDCPYHIDCYGRSVNLMRKTLNILSKKVNE